MSNTTPPPDSSPPLPSTQSPPPSSQPQAAPPPSTSTSAPPAQTPPPVNSPPPTTAPPPANSTSPPPVSPPVNSPPPPTPVVDPPVSSPPPPTPVVDPPVSSPPPPEPPKKSPPPPSSEPPVNSPPPPSKNPPQNSPPPPPSKNPPQNSPPPPPSSEPPQNDPPPPPSTLKPPQKAPPSPPIENPPETSPPPPPSSKPPSNSPPPVTIIPPSPTSQPIIPPSNSTPNSSLSPPPPSKTLPPPSSISPPSPAQTWDSPGGSIVPSSNGKSGLSSVAVVSISVVVVLAVLGLMVLLVCYFMKRKRKPSGLNRGYIMPSPYGSSPHSDSSLMKAHSALTGSGNDFVSSPTEPKSLGNSRSWFTYEEIVVATNGFSAQNVLGEGGFGLVYKGCLPDGRDIAVKQLKIGGGQGEREFKTEVEIISRIHHRHLVSLVGYCIAENQRLLIYEYVPNDTLYFHLHGEGQPVMDWGRRIRVAAGAAHGIAYLHEDCHPRIIHRDIKSSNILLDSNFEARVSDFGLAKLAMDANTHITTRVMGTFGYMAPEYASSGKLTDKSDVYSFGVVLLELITGRKSVDSSQPLGDESLVEWARPLLNDALDNEELDTLTDPRLGKNYVKSEMLQMIEAAAACVRHSAAKRPRMGQVVRALDSVAPADLTNGMRPGESRAFNPEQESADIRLIRRMAFGDQNYSTSLFSHSSLNSEVDIERSSVGKLEDL